MISLKTPTYSLADAFFYLESIENSLVRYISKQDFDNLFKVQPLNNEPSYQSVEVFLDIKKKKKINLVHSNLGYLYFNKGDCLDSFKLNKKKFYFDFKLTNSNVVYQRDEIRFINSGSANWKAIFDYEEIFDHFGLAGNDDFAPFVGFYVIKNLK